MLVDASAIAAELSMQPVTIRRMAKAGKIPSCRIGRNIRFDLAAVLKSLNS